MTTESNPYHGIPVKGPMIVLKDGRTVQRTRLNTPDEAFQLIQRHQGQSVAYALVHGGYRVQQVAADRWSVIEAAELRGMARHQLTDHGHDGYTDHPVGTPAAARSSSENAEMVHENCYACVAGGWFPNGTPLAVRAQGPNASMWTRHYVEAGFAIPRLWQEVFEATVREDEQEPFRRALLLDVATWGYHYDDELPDAPVVQERAREARGELTVLQEMDPAQ